MQLSRDTKRFLFLLSSFTVFLVLGASHFESIGNWLINALSTFSPFIVGACMAFILSVPMRLFDKLLSRDIRKGRPIMKQEARRGVSLVLSILLLLMIVSLFGMIVLPQLIDTVASMATGIMRFIPTAQS